MEKISSAIRIESTPVMAKLSASAPFANDEVRVVKKHEYKEAALTLAEAFKDDDLALYFVETDDSKHRTRQAKWDLHVSILEYLVYGHILKGLVTTIGPKYDCVALWMPPGCNMDDTLTCFRSGMWRLQYGCKLSAEGHKRYFSEFVPLLHDTKHEVLGSREDDSWYLVYIGTKPESRGKGFARSLIESISQKCDMEHRLCYLESSNAVNPQIYKKLGFEFVKTIHLTRATNPVDLDVMVRKPTTQMLDKKIGD